MGQFLSAGKINILYIRSYVKDKSGNEAGIMPERGMNEKTRLVGSRPYFSHPHTA